MAVESAADLATFFSTSEFATTHTWVQGGVSFNAILDAGWAELDLGGEVPVNSVAWKLTTRATDVAGIKAGDTISLLGSGSIFTVRDVRFDGIGVVELLLEAP